MNAGYFQSRSNGKIRVEMDEIWSFYHDKQHQRWLWWAIDHDTGEVIAYWFGTREHKNFYETVVASTVSKLPILSPSSIRASPQIAQFCEFEK